MADNEIKNADELSVNKPRKTAATAKKKTTPSAKKSATAKKSIVKKDDVTVTDNLKIDYEITFGHSILFVASEANPFAGTGGLADVIGSLPKNLALHDEFDNRVALPLYGSVSPAYRAMMRFEGNFNVPVAWRNQY